MAQKLSRVTRDIWALSLATFINRATGFLGLFAAVFFNEIKLDARAVVLALLIVGIRRRLDGLQTATRSRDTIDDLRQKATRTAVDLFGALLFGACCREAGDDALLYLTREGGEGLD